MSNPWLLKKQCLKVDIIHKIYLKDGKPIYFFKKAPVFKWLLLRILRRFLISIAKTVSKEIGSLICCTKCLSPEVALYLNETAIWSCLECYFHVWVGAPNLLLGNVR